MMFILYDYYNGFVVEHHLMFCIQLIRVHYTEGGQQKIYARYLLDTFNAKGKRKKKHNSYAPLLIPTNCLDGLAFDACHLPTVHSTKITKKSKNHPVFLAASSTYHKTNGSK